MNKLIYFHGFGSSGEGSTVKTLQELLSDWVVLAPDIPVDPAEALPFLKEFCKKEQPDVIVGTSMGGMYAQQMHGFKRICVNPAFDLPQHKANLYKGIFDFFNPRKNGKTTFTISPEIISHFKEMEARQFDGITDEDRDNVYGLFADKDTTVNCEAIFRQHYQNVVHFHGEHRLNRLVIEEVIVPLAQELVRREARQFETVMKLKPHKLTDELWGFVDENHKIVIDPEYIAVSRFISGVALVRKPNGALYFIDKKGNRVSNEIVPGHFDTLEYEERDPDRLYVAKCFIFNSGEVFVYEEETFLYSGCSSDSFCGYIPFYRSCKEFFDSQK